MNKVQGSSQGYQSTYTQNGHNQNNKRQYQSRPEGSVRIDYMPPKDKEARAADKAGEFVDFEEVK